jgi:hypothetical protein
MDATAGNVRRETLNGASLDLRRQLSYDHASVERFLAEAEAEQARLQGQIDAAVTRREAAHRAAEVREAQVHAELGAIVLSTWEEMERIEAGHAAIIATIRDAAAAEAVRVVAAAHREVASMRELTRSLLDALREGGLPVGPVGHLDLVSGHPDDADQADAG